MKDYYFLSCTPSSFATEDGKNISGQNLAILCRAVYSDGRPRWVIINKWVSADFPLPTLEPFHPVSVLADIDGKVTSVAPIYN